MSLISQLHNYVQLFEDLYSFTPFSYFISPFEPNVHYDANTRADCVLVCVFVLLQKVIR